MPLTPRRSFSRETTKRGFCCWTFRASLLDPHHRASVAVLSRIRHQKIATRQLVYRAPPRQRSLAAVIEKCILRVTRGSSESFASLLPILGQEKSHVRRRSSCYYLTFHNDIPTFMYERNCFMHLSKTISDTRVLLLGCPKNAFRYLHAAALSGYVDINMKPNLSNVLVFICDRFLARSRRARFVCIETKTIAQLLFSSKTKETFRTI